MHIDDAPLTTLFLPFDEGHLSWPDDGALFMRARYGEPLQRHSVPGLACEQTFKPDADDLQRAGLNVTSDAAIANSRRYSLVLLLPPRQRDEARAAMARGIGLLKPGGRLVACAGNNEGARSSESDLAQLAGPVQVMSKNKCRVFWTAPLNSPANAALAASWSELDAIRPIDANFFSRPGIFAWDRIDEASALLAQHLPQDLKGRAADLGAGFGYLSVELLNRCPGIQALDVYEAERRALDLAQRNLSRFEQRATLNYRWHDVAAGLAQKYDAIVSNPPFHAHSGADRPDIGRRFIVAAAEALRPGGRLWLVANRHLPYESALGERFGTVRIVAQARGYKVIEAIRDQAVAR